MAHLSLSVSTARKRKPPLTTAWPVTWPKLPMLALIAICPSVPDAVKEEILAAKGINSSDYGPPIGNEGISQRTSAQPSQLLRSSQDSVKTSGGQSTIPLLFDRSGEREVHMAVAEMVIGLGLPFDTVNQPLFHHMCNKISTFKSQYKPPTSYQLRTTLLRDTVAAVKTRLKVRFLSIRFNPCLYASCVI